MGWHGLCLVLLLSALLACLPHSQAGAAADNARDPLDLAWECEQAALDALETAQAKLQQLPPEAITPAMADAYYRQALDWVYAAVYTEIANNHDLLYSLECLQDITHEPFWPGDPLNAWEPLAILTPADPPAPGGLILQRCPPEEVSWAEGRNMDGHWPALLSFEVSIYGAELRAATNAVPQPGNAGWAVVPPGTLAMRGYYQPSIRDCGDPWEDVSAIIQAQRTEEACTTLALERFHQLVAPGEYQNSRMQWTLDLLVESIQHEQAIQRLGEQLRRCDPRHCDYWLMRDYLEHACWQVYFAALVFNNIHDYTCLDLDQLQAQGYLAALPANPLAGWRPMRLLGVADGFSAGDLCLQQCTPEWYVDGPHGVAPQTFILSVYGPTPTEPAPEQQEWIFVECRDWAVVPPGSLTMPGAFMQSLLETDYRRAVCFT